MYGLIMADFFDSEYLEAILNIDSEIQSSGRRESAAPTVIAESSNLIEHFAPLIVSGFIHKFNK